MICFSWLQSSAMILCIFFYIWLVSLLYLIDSIRLWESVYKVDGFLNLLQSSIITDTSAEWIKVSSSKVSFCYDLGSNCLFIFLFFPLLQWEQKNLMSMVETEPIIFKRRKHIISVICLMWSFQILTHKSYLLINEI